MTERAAEQLGASPEYSVEQSPLGRVVIAPNVPRGYALFYTTRDIDGRVDPVPFIRARFGIECAFYTCNQVHGMQVVKVGGAPGDSPGERRRMAALSRRSPGEVAGRSTDCGTCDALWSDAPNTALGIKVADCLPVTLIDPERGLMANIHSGWRGAVQRIVDTTLDAVGPSPSMMAWLGPSIRVCCFEVGEEVAAQFPAHVADRARGPKPHIDLVALTTELLQARGISKIYDSGLCTRCGELFHSYRRERKSGRNLAIVAR